MFTVAAGTTAADSQLSRLCAIQLYWISLVGFQPPVAGKFWWTLFPKRNIFLLMSCICNRVV